MNTLLYFTNDLRLHDNPAITLSCQSATALSCVYCIDERWFKRDTYGLKPMGSARWQFLQETLHELNESLQAMGQKLEVFYGNPSTLLKEIIEDNKIDHVISSRQFAYYENTYLNQLKSHFPHIRFSEADSFTLFEQSQLPKQAPFPPTFSRFRREVEHLAVNRELDTPASMPPILAINPPTSAHLPTPAIQVHKLPMHGGESSALSHLESYFKSGAASHYKDTRNALDGWENSCKFSPWLACGSLSVRTIVNRLQNYEAKYGSNDSTQWIYFELLWREYFQWYSLHYKHKLFIFHGIKEPKNKPLTSFYPQRFKQWTNGQTPWPLVNACMQELNATGYLSNRARQIVASCLVNELSLDWRSGAAYFEQQLIDYDPAANWGNWQYIAGVGADPRGGRHFNLEKQTELFDPDRRYINHWLDSGAPTISVVDYIDAADWPIAPTQPLTGSSHHK